MKVLFIDPVPPDLIAPLRAQLPPEVELLVVPSLSDAALTRLAADADVLLRTVRPVDAALLRAAPRVRFLQQLGAGYDNIDLAAARAAGIRVAHTPGANAGAVAEHVVLLMLALLKRFVPAEQHTRAGHFAPLSFVQGGLGDLATATVGLVGLGYIGQAVAARLGAFGPRLLYTARPRVDRATEDRLGVTFLPLRDLLQQATIVSLHVPLTADTRGLIGEAELAAMPAGAYLVNTARGGVVDEAALRRAIERGHLAGAALDVLAEEREGGNPVRDLPTVLVTPHIAGATRAARERVWAMVSANLLRYSKGEEPHDLLPDAAYGLA